MTDRSRKQTLTESHPPAGGGPSFFETVGTQYGANSSMSHDEQTPEEQRWFREMISQLNPKLVMPGGVVIEDTDPGAFDDASLFTDGTDDELAELLDNMKPEEPDPALTDKIVSSIVGPDIPTVRFESLMPIAAEQNKPTGAEQDKGLRFS